jgi:hypothetical protein
VNINHGSVIRMTSRRGKISLDTQNDDNSELSKDAKMIETDIRAVSLKMPDGRYACALVLLAGTDVRQRWQAAQF